MRRLRAPERPPGRRRDRRRRGPRPSHVALQDDVRSRPSRAASASKAVARVRRPRAARRTAPPGRVGEKSLGLELRRRRQKQFQTIRLQAECDDQPFDGLRAKTRASRRTRPVSPVREKSCADRRRASRETAAARFPAAASPPRQALLRKNHDRIGAQRQRILAALIFGDQRNALLSRGIKGRPQRRRTPDMDEFDAFARRQFRQPATIERRRPGISRRRRDRAGKRRRAPAIR